MTQWYVKDLSKLTHISVQTLHHYDRIGLLKPSVRLPNGYRLYSEKDLLKLQQIIALKFFGFELSQIKKLLTVEVDMLDHFSVQSRFLEEKAKALLTASSALKGIISDCSHHKSIPWETIIKLIEVYRMTQQLEKTWAGKVLTPDELKEYAHFEQSLKARFTESEQKAFEQSWADLANEIGANLDKDPNSDLGIDLGKRCMDWVNCLYGKKYVNLRNAIWEKGFKSSQMDDDYLLSPAMVDWLDKAIDAYYRDRIIKLLAQAEKNPNDATLIKLWNTLLTDMYGDDQASIKDFFDTVMKDDKTSQAAKNWLKRVSKS